MSNWCINRLQIIGRPNEIDQCLEAIKGKDTAFDFNTLIPYPGGQEPQNHGYDFLLCNGSIVADGEENGREWCVRHWNTKWNAQRVPAGCGAHPIAAQKILGGAEIVFDTDCGPPLPVLRELSRRFPRLDVRLRFLVDESVNGLARFKNGEMVFGERIDISSYDIPNPDWEELLNRAGREMRHIGRLSFPTRAMNRARRCNCRSCTDLQKDSSAYSISEDAPF